MPADLTPEALDALIERFKAEMGHCLSAAYAVGYYGDAATIADEMVAALRAAPVAMRERVWNEAVTASAQMAGLWSVPEDGPDMTEAEGRAFADGKLHAVEMVRKLLKPALPLDAPAPTEPYKSALKGNEVPTLAAALALPEIASIVKRAEAVVKHYRIVHEGYMQTTGALLLGELNAALRAASEKE